MLEIFFDYISALPQTLHVWWRVIFTLHLRSKCWEKTSRMKWSVIFGRWAAGGPYTCPYIFLGGREGRMSASQILLIKFGVRQLRSVEKLPSLHHSRLGFPVPQGGHHSLPTRFGRNANFGLRGCKGPRTAWRCAAVLFFLLEGSRGVNDSILQTSKFPRPKLGRFAKVSNIHSRAGNRDAELVAIFKETTKSLAIVLNLEVSALIPKEPASWSPEVHHANHLFDRSVVTSFTTMF